MKIVCHSKNKKLINISLALLAGLLFPLLSLADPIELRLWNRNYDTAPIDKIVSLALEKTQDLYGEVRLLRSSPMEQNQALDALEKKDGLDLMSAAASSSHDKRFLAVRFPLLKGLLGHRLCLIRKGDQQVFNDIVTAYDFTLKNLKVCQGEFWPDTPVLRRNGFQVETSKVYRDLFTMLKNKQCDCFLRGAQEISAELASRSSDLSIEDNLAIFYKQPGVLYLNKKDHALAARLELGLLRALDDGSFDLLFKQLLETKIHTLNLPNRHYISLENPFLPDTLRSLNGTREIWYQP